MAVTTVASKTPTPNKTGGGVTVSLGLFSVSVLGFSLGILSVSSDTLETSVLLGIAAFSLTFSVVIKSLDSITSFISSRDTFRFSDRYV
ncbi:photosystem II biosynthesis protein [Terasakiella sp.]|uniref:photosystem II biosynthesis protein n=1 Tax=Terasakiella sp. TaxID=2034861 RepID=UPI003AA9AB34